MSGMSITDMLKIQYNDGYNMLKEFVRVCPDDLWKAENHGLPLWNHVAHSLCGTAFWLRADYNADFEWYFPFPENVKDKLEMDDWCSPDDGYMSKAEMSACFEILDEKLNEFWSSITDDVLGNKIWEKYDFTYLSVITSQIRHIMCHVGMCSAALIENGYDEVKWIAYGEGK